MRDININTKRTDLLKWRLKAKNGRQTWHYLDDEDEIKNWPQSAIDKYSLGLPFKTKEFIKPTKALEAAKNGFKFYKQLQTEGGHWTADCGGPMFLTPGIVISMYITQIPIPESWRVEMIRYLFNRAHPVDGGWGLHTEHHSTVFGTAMNYVVLRILGVDADHPSMVKARLTLHKLGGAISIPSWGKFWLASLNVYDWDGINPIPPELWLFPYSFPFHPARYWIHTRVVYLPMGYIYGRRFRAKETPLIMQLRQELYTQPYETINWTKARGNIAEVDVSVPHSKLLKFVNSEDPTFHESSLKALKYIDYSQFRKDPVNYSRCYRAPTKGAWGFSTRDQGYFVSDCTSIGVKSAIELQKRVYQAIDLLLNNQNSDGGFASFEKIRGISFLEWINPSEMFGNIMIEYNYPECTSSVITALNTFSKYYPDYRAEEIKETCEKAINYIHDSQRNDGSWYGSWGICFTYAAMFALECLASYGETYENSESVRKGCKFLITKQKKDGGWEYVQHEKSQVVNTSWALLALMYAKYPYEKDIRRGIQLLMSRQLSNGEWKQEASEGVFSKYCTIRYPSYKFIFTIWALGKYAKIYNDPIVFK
ncbi:4222_t:CDS:10 [Diversispora eburnea]|uniref:lanosterol synthase n=1 Tax=Diversispora eburnea TaxID=1213867 RepID=A0A9N9BL28_9GLOM|nr:4222_t:CDS:10 [Diversispora eburnea]